MAAVRQRARAFFTLGLAFASSLLQASRGQQAGKVNKEEHPQLRLHQCTPSGRCKEERAGVTLDAQYRWVHDIESYDDCLPGDWAEDLCPDGDRCARHCAIEGVDLESYEGTYGIKSFDDEEGLRLRFRTRGKFGTTYGSRVLLTEGKGDVYKVFRLKNREFSFKVDVSKLPCGLNGAVYFTTMDNLGEKGLGENAAGAKFGLGYCDSLCHRSLHFLQGEANVKDWDKHSGTGRYGACCPELDIFEANRNSTAMSLHTCEQAQPSRCEGDACSETCDKDGCRYNPYQMGHHAFFGPGLLVDSLRPFTVVTQFVTVDGTDEGELSEIRRYYLQDDRTIMNPGKTTDTEFEIVLDRTDGKKLGILGELFGGTFRIDQIEEDGVMKEWNDAAVHSRKRVTKGDRVIAVNGVRGNATSIVAEMQKKAVLKCTIAREIGETFLAIDEGVCEKVPSTSSSGGFKPKDGHLKAMSEALDHGMALVLSLYDDPDEHLSWLDNDSGPRKTDFTGPCFGPPKDLRTEDSNGAAVDFSNIRFGPIGSTCSTCQPPTTSTSTTAATQSTTSTSTLTSTSSTTTTATAVFVRQAYANPIFITLSAVAILSVPAVLGAKAYLSFATSRTITVAKRAERRESLVTEAE